MLRRLLVLAGLVGWAALPTASIAAESRVPIVATFSILGDFVSEIGGDRVAVTSLVGPNGDAHAFSSTPADARAIGAAKLVVGNGLGFEPWLAKLASASGTKAAIVLAATGVVPRKADKEAGEAGGAHGKEAGVDPHAWQSVANAKIYVANIRDALSAADPDGRTSYEARAADYLGQLDKLEGEIRAALAPIPPARRKVVTTHDAFGYFGQAYGIAFIAPKGMSTETEASAKDVAKLVRQIRRQSITAVFMENITDGRLIEQIARETGSRIGERVYSDALSEPGGPAATYLTMMRHNIRAFAAALMPGV